MTNEELYEKLRQVVDDTRREISGTLSDHVKDDRHQFDNLNLRLNRAEVRLARWGGGLAVVAAILGLAQVAAAYWR